MKNIKKSCITAIAMLCALLTVVILSISLLVTRHQLQEELEYNEYQDAIILALYEYYNLTVDDITTDAEVEAAQEVEDKWLDY